MASREIESFLLCVAVEQTSLLSVPSGSVKN
jgi:hypothetical protein